MFSDRHCVAFSDYGNGLANQLNAGLRLARRAQAFHLKFAEISTAFSTQILALVTQHQDELEQSKDHVQTNEWTQLLFKVAVLGQSFAEFQQLSECTATLDKVQSTVGEYTTLLNGLNVKKDTCGKNLSNSRQNFSKAQEKYQKSSPASNRKKFTADRKNRIEKYVGYKRGCEEANAIGYEHRDRVLGCVDTALVTGLSLSLSVCVYIYILSISLFTLYLNCIHRADQVRFSLVQYTYTYSLFLYLPIYICIYQL